MEGTPSEVNDAFVSEGGRDNFSKPCDPLVDVVFEASDSDDASCQFIGLNDTAEMIPQIVPDVRDVRGYRWFTTCCVGDKCTACMSM